MLYILSFHSNFSRKGHSANLSHFKVHREEPVRHPYIMKTFIPLLLTLIFLITLCCIFLIKLPDISNTSNVPSTSTSRPTTDASLSSPVPSSDCHLTIQNNDPSLDDILRRYQIAFNTVCPELVARFALQPDVAKNVVVTVSHIDAAALTSGGHITLDDNFARQNLKQVVGALIHELTHVVQAGENAPGWFIEGMADYARSIYGPADDDWSMPPVQPGDSYNNAYRVAARFLHWLDQHTVPTIVDQLSHAAQTGGSFSATFQRLTGDTVDGEWSKYVANSTLAPFKRIPAPDN